MHAYILQVWKEASAGWCGATAFRLIAGDSACKCCVSAAAGMALPAVPVGAGEVSALAAFCFAACIALSTVREERRWWWAAGWLGREVPEELGLRPQLCRDALTMRGRSRAAGREPQHLPKEECCAQ